MNDRELAVYINKYNGYGPLNTNIVFRRDHGDLYVSRYDPPPMFYFESERHVKEEYKRLLEVIQPEKVLLVPEEKLEDVALESSQIAFSKIFNHPSYTWIPIEVLLSDGPEKVKEVFVQAHVMGNWAASSVGLTYTPSKMSPGNDAWSEKDRLRQMYFLYRVLGLGLSPGWDGRYLPFFSMSSYGERIYKLLGALKSGNNNRGKLRYSYTETN